jgi:catechol 2,3-dioxygenase-like lactoylglutathione lyase family enzyme
MSMNEGHLVTGINHITLAVSDLNRSFHFYVDVVGLKPVAKWERGAYFLAGNDWVCLSLDAATREGPQREYTHVAFSVGSSSFHDRVKLVRSSGQGIWKENTSEGDSLYFLDPDGHKLEFHVGDLESRLAALKEKPYQGLELYG